MDYWSTVWSQLISALPSMLAFSLITLVPFAIAERVWPVVRPPRLRSYAINIAISLTTLILSLPLGIAAGLAAAKVHASLGWQPFPVPFAALEALPVVGRVLKGLTLMLAPLLLHDLWFYWSHRLEHRIPILWAFHSLHHSDPEMNCTTWARDHFLQSAWRTFFSVFTLGLLVDLDMKSAGTAAMLSQMALVLWSMFYHSAIRVELPWLDRVLVTPQVHRIHHAVDDAHHDRNFADVFPFMDILFGTYEKPRRGEFAGTGINDAFLLPRSPISAQVNPVIRALGLK